MLLSTWGGLSKTARGQRAERQAEAWWCQRFPNSVVVARNYRTRWGEIDLVIEREMEKGCWRLFWIEVRSRGAGSLFSAAESVDFWKRRRLLKTAEVFLQAYCGRATESEWVLLVCEGAGWELYEHLEGG